MKLFQFINKLLGAARH